MKILMINMIFHMMELIIMVMVKLMKHGNTIMMEMEPVIGAQQWTLI